MALTAEKHARLFKHGDGHAVQIPPEFELSSEEVVIRQEGRRLVIEPAPAHSLLDVLSRLEPIAEDFPPIDELPIDAIEL